MSDRKPLGQSSGTWMALVKTMDGPPHILCLSFRDRSLLFVVEKHEFGFVDIEEHLHSCSRYREGVFK